MIETVFINCYNDLKTVERVEEKPKTLLVRRFVEYLARTGCELTVISIEEKLRLFLKSLNVIPYNADTLTGTLQYMFQCNLKLNGVKYTLKITVEIYTINATRERVKRAALAMRKFTLQRKLARLALPNGSFVNKVQVDVEMV